MDSPSLDEYATSSPEETGDIAPKRSNSRSSNNPRSPRDTHDEFEDEKEKTTQIRFLVSNTAAGSIIGKGGSSINELQSQSGARIQLSRNQEYFPGTSDRIIMVSGTYNEILRAMELILEKLVNEAEESSDAESRSKVRLVVPNSSCGGIIGKGGSNIKSLIEESQADIKISPQEHNYVGVNDRLVTVMGTFDQQMSAISHILSKLLEDSHYPQSLNSPFTYAVSGGYPGGYGVPSPAYNPSYGSNGYGARYPNNKGRSPAGPQESNSVIIGVADEHIGAVVGRAGRNIMEITQISGARIKISDRGDFMPGTTDRKVTITGATEAIRSAENMILQKVSANAERDQ